MAKYKWWEKKQKLKEIGLLSAWMNDPARIEVTTTDGAITRENLTDLWQGLTENQGYGEPTLMMPANNYADLLRLEAPARGLASDLVVFDEAGVNDLAELIQAQTTEIMGRTSIAPAILGVNNGT